MALARSGRALPRGLLAAQSVYRGPERYHNLVVVDAKE
jgi:hypothetical protein